MAGNLSAIFEHTRKSTANQEQTAAVPGPVSAERALPKSQDKVNYAKTTVYLRKETRKETARKLLDDGRELSEIVNDLLNGWTSGSLNV